VDHPDDFDSASNEPIVDQVAGVAKPPQAGSEVVARNTEARVCCKHAEPLLEPVDEAIGVPDAVACDVIPDLVDVGLSERRDD
jgi:hypothetical protein